MIREIDEKDVPRLKEIWRDTFSDPDVYIDDVIFKYKVTKDTALLLEKDGEVASVLYMPGSEFSFWGDPLPASYVMGVATASEHRGHAYMKTLMDEALRRMYRSGTVFCTLIPAEDWLYNYYSSFGFSEAFYQKRERVNVKRNSFFDIEVAGGKSEEELYRFYHNFYVNSLFCVRKSPRDFKAVLKDHALGGGHVRVAKKNGRICGICFVIDTDGCTIKEMCAEDETVREALISDAASMYGKNYVNIISRPDKSDTQGVYRRGMIRAVRFFDALSCYAKAHAGDNFTFSVADDIINENSGVYKIENGRAFKISDSRGENPLSPAEAVRLLFSEERCYMNLMLD